MLSTESSSSMSSMLSMWLGKTCHNKPGTYSSTADQHRVWGCFEMSRLSHIHIYQQISTNPPRHAYIDRVHKLSYTVARLMFPAFQPVRSFLSESRMSPVFTVLLTSCYLFLPHFIIGMSELLLNKGFKI